MTTIILPLRNGMSTIVDEADIPLVERHWWNARRAAAMCENWHVYTFIGGKITYLHRLLLNPPEGRHVDHIDRNGLNNSRANLRLCTPSQNNANRAFKGGAEGFIGVERPAGVSYRGSVQVLRKNYRTRSYPTAEEAARARDDLARKYFGEFAVLNFPGGGRA